MPTVAFSTLGCRLNQAESDAMAEQLARAGFSPARPGEVPDVVVVNTCTVTGEATKASRGAIRRAVRDNPGARVVVTGCYAVSDPEAVRAIEGVDEVVGNGDKDDLVAALARRETLRPLLQIGMGRPAAAPPGPARVRANLKVQTGCDEWCSFCIIPTTRGPLHSRDEDALVREARARVASGARELVLTGVHLGKYGYDRGGDERDLVRLMRRLLDIEGVARLRLSSILSNHLTDDVVGFIASEPRVCRYLHVPLQSGDDGVLAAMNRPYDATSYLEAVERAARHIDGLALATDVIVGFPGETEEAFAATMEVVRRVGFCKLHVFRYSPRPGTVAADSPSHPEVDPEVRRRRSRALIELGNSLRTRFLQERLGQELEVLVEDEREVEGTPVSSGQTGDWVRVWFEGRGLLGRLVRVRGERLRADGLRGELVAGGPDEGGEP